MTIYIIQEGRDSIKTDREVDVPWIEAGDALQIAIVVANGDEQSENIASRRLLPGQDGSARVQCGPSKSLRGAGGARRAAKYGYNMRPPGSAFRTASENCCLRAP
jgi:hypothetical protein